MEKQLNDDTQQNVVSLYKPRFRVKARARRTSQSDYDAYYEQQRMDASNERLTP